MSASNIRPMFGQKIGLTAGRGFYTARSVLAATSHPGSGSLPTDVSTKWHKRRGVVGAVVGTAVGATAAVVAAPLVIGAMGFGAGGIVAGSYAAAMMSSAAIAKGGAVAAGSLVSILQTIGATSFSLAGWLGVGAAGAAAGVTVGVVADMAAGIETGSTPPDGAQEVGEDVENSDDEGANGGEEISDDMARLKVKKKSQPITTNLVSIIISESGEDVEISDDDGENGGEENSDDMARLKVTKKSQKITTNLLSIIISESDGIARRFEVNSSEPLQGMFDEYFEQTGLSSDSVMFEFNGLCLVGFECPQELEIEDDYIIKALRIRD